MLDDITQCPVLSAQCPVPSAQCPVPSAQCSVPSAQCLFTSISVNVLADSPRGEFSSTLCCSTVADPAMAPCFHRTIAAHICVPTAL